jgi:hypothetical protein
MMVREIIVNIISAIIVIFCFSGVFTLILFMNS